MMNNFFDGFAVFIIPEHLGKTGNMLQLHKLQRLHAKLSIML